jgi:neutral trehalase
MVRLWPKLVAWLAWIHRARTGPRGASVVVHPWESGMDNSPAWDEALVAVPEADHRHLKRRDVATVAASQRPTNREYRHYLGIVMALREAGWDTERQVTDSPFAVEDPSFTAITARAAIDLAAVAPQLGEDASQVTRIADDLRAGLSGLWDERAGWFRASNAKTGRRVGPATIAGLFALYADAANDVQRAGLIARLGAWERLVPVTVPSSDPSASTFDADRYWRGPVWVLTNWIVADGLERAGYDNRASSLRALTHSLVENAGFREYYDPRNGEGIGGYGFSWSAALTLAWLT